jgi:ATP-dependent Clp protease protease subunit
MNGTIESNMDQKIDNMSFVDESVRSALLDNSIHYFSGEIEEDNIAEAIRWVIFENLKGEDETKPLVLYINSIGGDLAEAQALIAVMRKSKRPICTIGVGSVCSAAFMVFAAGTKGFRFISDTASIMCHQFSGGIEGKYHDMKSMFKENELMNDRMVKLLQEFTGLEPKKIKSKLLPPSDVWFTADEVIELGVADHIF